VAIHICNALLANGTPIESSKNISIKTWGPTSAFCSGQKPYSLIPLISAYCSSEIYENLGEALQECVLSDFKGVRHSSVARAMRGMIGALVEKF
jgi:hypothetical protein